MRQVVIDVSAAISVVTGGKRREEFLKALSNAPLVLAPDLFVSEVVNAAWKYHHIQELPEADAVSLAEQATALIDTIIPIEPWLADAVRLSCQLEHPAYDCFYLLLAQQKQAILLTLDKKLIRLATGLGIDTLANV